MIKILINNLDSFQLWRICKFLNRYKFDVIDVGAHKGDFINYCLKYLNPKRVFGFEPQRNINYILKKKFKKNKVKISNFAISKNNKKKILYINKFNKTSSLSKKTIFSKSIFNKLKNLLLRSKIYEDKYSVKTTSLDNFFSKKKLLKTLLKIDVEGYEMNVLLGSKKVLKRIDMILIEKQNLKNNNFDQCHRYLLKKNFILFKTFLFPLMHFEDKLYVKKYLIYNNSYYE